MKRFNAKYKAILKSRKKTLWFSAINAILLLLICYFADNLKYSVVSGPSVGQHIEQFREITGLSNSDIPEEYIFINVAYDRQLVSVCDEYGFPQGNMDIADREKLALLLRQLNNTHKYVLFDVLLSDRYHSDADSILTDALLSTDRISIARSSTTPLIDERLISRSGYTDYSTDILETNFVKYQFTKDGELTMPYMAYKYFDPKSHIYSLGPIFWCNWHLYWNSLTLRFPIKGWDNSNEENSIWQEKRILNLGADILDLDIDIASMVRDKIVVIGDFTEDDIHDTYLGKIAGPIINVNAFEALRNNELEIPWRLIIFLLVLYTVITYWSIKQPISSDKLLTKLHLNSSLVKYLISFIGYSFLLSLIGGVIYLLSGNDVNIIIPSLWFTFLRGYTNTFVK